MASSLSGVNSFTKALGSKDSQKGNCGIISKPATPLQPEPLLQDYSGYLEKIFFQRDDWLAGLFRLNNEENGLSGRTIKIAGSFYKVRPGDQLRIWGAWQTHRRYGEQFTVERYERPVPTDKEALKIYLGSGLIKGVGPTIAGRIIECFGEDSLEVALKEPEKLAEVQGITIERAMAIGQAVQDSLAFQNVVSFLLPYGVSARMALRIFRELGPQAVERLQENPYALTEVKLIGFLRADAIARAMGVEGDSTYRVRAALAYVLEESAEKEGHCYLPLPELMSRSAAMLNPDLVGPEDLLREVKALVAEKRLVLEEERVYLYHHQRLEIEAARKVKSFLAVPVGPGDPGLDNVLLDYERVDGMVLAAAQKETIRRVCREGFLVLTGGPGTGKTQTIKAVVDVMRRLWQSSGRSFKTELAAPTGRASRRLAEVTGLKAQTLHRLLGLKPEGGEVQVVKADLLVVDEFSMVDLPLFASLMQALSPGTKVLLVGDMDQLPSVGPGDVLRDLLAAGAPSVHLTEIFRQAAQSQVVLNAHLVNRGENRLVTGQDFFFIQEEDSEQAASTIVETVERYLESLAGLDDIQVLTPMKKGPLGTAALNARLQARLNPPASGKAEVRLDQWVVLRQGDKVIQLVNDYGKGVFNGDIGRVAELVQQDAGPVLRVEFGEGEIVEYSEDELEALALAHALTVHKSQGSEYQVVVMPVSTQHYVMLARNLVYTAITRARQKVILVGSRKALALAIRNNRMNHRYTGLDDRLKDPDRH